MVLRLQTSRITSRLALKPAIAAALLPAGFTLLCCESHSALAVTFGGLLATTLALPLLAIASGQLVDALLVMVITCCAVAAAWMLLAIAWAQWWSCVAVLVAFSLAVASSTLALRRLGVHQNVSAVITLIVALAWLSWPVWLSPWLPGHQDLVNRLVSVHPLLAVNGALIDQGIWTERPLMYGWTALNQDVTFSMPMSVTRCVMLHMGLGVALMVSRIPSRLLLQQSLRLR